MIEATLFKVCTYLAIAIVKRSSFADSLHVGLGWVGLWALDQQPASRHFSMAPSPPIINLRTFNFTSGGVTPEERIPPQSRVYGQVHTDRSHPYSIFIKGVSQL